MLSMPNLVISTQLIPTPWNDRVAAINVDDVAKQEANQDKVDPSEKFVLHVWDRSFGCKFLVDSGA